jgi:phage shock protein C
MARGILYRNVDDKALAGVCGGLGKYFDIDPILFRVGFLLFLPLTVWLYLILWISVPEDPNWKPSL